VFFDGPGGTQVSQAVIDAYGRSLIEANANRHAPFPGGDRLEQSIENALEWAGAFLGSRSTREIVFGQNMTSLAFHLADALAGFLNPDQEIIVTGIDHDANIAPWLHAARRCGARVKIWPMRIETGTLELGDLLPLLGPKTAWVAFTGASNALGTTTPLADTIRAIRAHTKAMVFVDCVHLSPHILPSAAYWDADFVAVSPYKFFGPHLGILCGRESCLERLTPPKVRPSPAYLPDAWMTGTQNHEAIHAMAAGLEHLASLGGLPEKDQPGGRRRALETSYQLIAEHETRLTQQFLEGVQNLNRVKVHGPQEAGPRRVSTFGLELKDHQPQEMARKLGKLGFRTYAGNFYALSVTEALGLEGKGGLLRVGLVHYNTEEEVDRFLNAFRSLLSE